MTTSAEEVHNGTAMNDTFDATVKNSLNTGDIILDNSSDDSDVINATVTANNNAPRVSNVETINVDGLYTTTGLTLTNVAGATDLNLNTGIIGGTATVAGAYSLNVANINAGTSITTLDITSSAAGTRDTVNVDAGSADLNLTGDAGGADLYSATVAADATVVLTTVGANDNITLDIAGDLALTGVVALEDLTINADTAASEITVTTALSADTVISGSQAVTITGIGAAFTAKGMTSTNTAGVTVELGTVVDGQMFNEIVVDQVNVTVDTDGATLTFNQDSIINVKEDLGATTDVVTLDVDNVDADLAAASGTLLLNISDSQTGGLIAGANVGTVILNATPDEAADTADGAEIVIGSAQETATDGLDMNAAETLVIQGSNNVTITNLTNVATGVVSASSMSGELTIGDTAAAGTFVLGSGNDTISDTKDGATATIHAGAGDDTITTGTGNNTVNGEGDNDTITTVGGDDTIDGGTGNDTIAAGLGDNTITTGAGTDTVTFVASDAVNNGANDTTISDFTKGTDTLVFTGVTADTTVDLTDLTVASGVYTFADEFVITLTNNTAIDMSDSVQLGESDALFTVAVDSTTVAGDLNDSMTATGASTASITTGAGSDVIYKASGAGVLTVTDFTVGTDKIVLTGATGTGVDLSAVVSGVDGVYNDVDNGVYDVTLTDVTATDITAIFALGDADNVFIGLDNGVSVGGDFADNILSGADAANGHATSITGGLGADTIEVVDGDAIETVVIAAGDSTTTAWDKITSWDIAGANEANNDVLDLDSTNVSTVVATTQVGDITGVTVTDGVITAWAGISNTINQTTLEDALSFLATNVGGTDTVAFEYNHDLNADGDVADTDEYASTFVFQSGTTDTLVEMIGLTGVTAVAATAGGAANMIELA